MTARTLYRWRSLPATDHFELLLSDCFASGYSFALSLTGNDLRAPIKLVRRWKNSTDISATAGVSIRSACVTELIHAPMSNALYMTVSSSIEQKRLIVSAAEPESRAALHTFHTFASGHT